MHTHTPSLFMRESYAGRKEAQKNLTCRDGVQVLGTQANLVKEHSTDYLDVMQKDCASMLHKYLNLSYWT
jgi:hypothetical protein